MQRLDTFNRLEVATVHRGCYCSSQELHLCKTVCLNNKVLQLKTQSKYSVDQLFKTVCFSRFMIIHIRTVIAFGKFNLLVLK